MYIYNRKGNVVLLMTYLQFLWIKLFIIIIL